MKTGKIDAGKLFAEIDKRMGANPSGWAMLDYEDPFDAWLDLPPNDPRNRAACAEMVRVIKLVKARYPNVRWTYYAQPRLARWMPDEKGVERGWPVSTEAMKQAEIDRRFASTADIVRELDWINPSIYDVYENDMFKGDEGAVMLANEEIWRQEAVKLGRTFRQRLGLPQIPVMPCVSMLFQPGGRATAMKPIPITELLSDQIDPALRGGADGFTVWSGIDFAQMLATLPNDHPLTPMNKDTQKWARDAWTASFFGGKAPRDWTDPDVRFKLSQDTGKAVSDAALAIDARVREVRSGAGVPAAPPAGTPAAPAAK